jgi:hypothetical protein
MLADACVVPGAIAKCCAVMIGYPDVFPEITLRIGAPSDGEKVDALNEKFGVTATFPAHRFHKVFKARNEFVRADPHQRA